VTRPRKELHIVDPRNYEKAEAIYIMREKASAFMKIVGQTKDSTKAWAQKEKKDGIKRKNQNIYKEIKNRWEINKL
jgi:hypothetical protein